MSEQNEKAINILRAAREQPLPCVYLCPVCDYTLDNPPRDWHICPQCGVEFENDDFDVSYSDLRARWIGAGKPFWRTETKKSGWQEWYQDQLHPPRPGLIISMLLCTMGGFAFGCLFGGAVMWAMGRGM